MTIDPDTEILIREEVQRSGLSFKKVLNRAIRRALGGHQQKENITVEPLFKAPFPPELGAANFNQLADELDDEKTLAELQSFQ